MNNKEKVDHDALVASAVMIGIGSFLIGGAFFCNSPDHSLEQKLNNVPEEIHEDATDYGIDSNVEYDDDGDGDCYNK